MDNPFDQFDTGFTGVVRGAPKTPPIPSGYEPDPGKPGAVRPIEGGPSDPSAAADTLDPATVSFYAQQVLAGAPMPSMGMGKQASKMREEVMKEVARQAGAQGLGGADLAKQIAHYQSGKKQLGTLEQQLGTTRQNEETALLNGQQFIDRSADLPLQTEYPGLNAVTQFLQKNIRIPGHQTKVAMDQAYNTFVNEYAKVVAGSPSGSGVLSDSARHEAMSALTGNYSLSQKKAVFEQMQKDMANRMTAMKSGINQGYDALVNQPGYEVPDSLTDIPAVSHKQDSIFIPGVGYVTPTDGAPPPAGGGSGGGDAPVPPALSDLTSDQKNAYIAFIAANPKPEGPTLKTFLEKLTGKSVTNADEIAKAIAEGRGFGTTVADFTEQQKVQRRIEQEDKHGLNNSPTQTMLMAGVPLSDEAAGIGEAGANIITSPFTGNFDPVGSYQLGRDVERQRVVDARNALGWAATPVEFLGAMGSASPTNAIASVADNLPAMIRMGAKGGAVGGAITGFGAGEGAQQSVAGAVAGGVGGAAVGAAAPWAANRISANNAMRGLAPDVADAAQAESVDLIRPMVDPSVRGKFGALESAPGSQNVIRDAVSKVRGQIEGRVADLGQGAAALEPGAAGERLQLSGNRYIERSKGIKDRLYRAAENAGGADRFVPKDAIAQADQEIANLSANKSTNSGEIAFLQGIRDDLAAPGGKTVAEIRNIREGLRGAIGNSNLTMSGAEARANSILHAAGSDITTALPEAGRLYKRADAFYRERQTVVDDIKKAILGQKNNPLDPQAAFQNIKTLAAPGGNLRRLAAVTRYLEPGERQDVAATVASTLGRKAQDAPFTTDLFLSQTDKMSPGALRTIFGPDGAQSISNLRLLSQKLKEGVGDLNRSKTANSMWRLMAGKLVGSLTGLGGTAGLLEGGLTGGATGAATGVAVGAAVKGVGVFRNVLSARAMVNPRVTQWLAQTAEVSTPSQAKQAVKGLSLVISREPAIANELMPLRDFLNQRVTQLLAAEPNTEDGNNEQR